MFSARLEYSVRHSGSPLEANVYIRLLIFRNELLRQIGRQLPGQVGEQFLGLVDGWLLGQVANQIVGHVGFQVLVCAERLPSNETDIGVIRGALEAVLVDIQMH